MPLQPEPFFLQALGGRAAAEYAQKLLEARKPIPAEPVTGGGLQRHSTVLWPIEQ
jgi:hypothetical protein